ncbi:MAG: hypothetical protein QM704_10610 [Anaeromyxobacteraceae bacterium]
MIAAPSSTSRPEASTTRVGMGGIAARIRGAKAPRTPNPKTITTTSAAQYLFMAPQS